MVLLQEGDRQTPWLLIVLSLAFCVGVSRSLEKNGDQYCEALTPLLLKFEENVAAKMPTFGCGELSMGECFGSMKRRTSHRLFGTPCPECEEEQVGEGVEGGVEGAAKAESDGPPKDDKITTMNRAERIVEEARGVGGEKKAWWRRW